MNTKTKKLISFHFLIALFLFIYNDKVACATDTVFLFSEKGKYIELNIGTETIVKRGDLWRSGIYSIYGGKIGHNGKKMYLKSDYALFVLDTDTFDLLKKFELPSSPQDLIHFFISPAEHRIVVSRIDTQTGKVITKLYDNKTFKEIREIPCDALSTTSHFLDSQRIVFIDMINGERGVVTLNIENGEIASKMPLKCIVKSIGMNDRLVSVDASKGNLLFLKICSSNGTDHKKIKKTMFIYDVLTNKSTPDIKVTDGYYKLFCNSKRIAIDEINYVDVGPNLRRIRKAGRIHFFDMESMEKISTVLVPRQGKIGGFSPDGRKTYYLSHGVLTVIDIDSATIEKKINFLNQMIPGKQTHYEKEEGLIFNTVLLKPCSRVGSVVKPNNK